MTAVPAPAAVATYLGASVPEGDPRLVSALAAETNAQAAACRVDPYNDNLAEALCRRVARNLAMRGVPLGVQNDEFGGTRLGSTDPEVRRLEAPYRRVSVG